MSQEIKRSRIEEPVEEPIEEQVEEPELVYNEITKSYVTKKKDEFIRKSAKRMLVRIPNEDIDKLTEEERPESIILKMETETIVVYENTEKVPERYSKLKTRNYIFKCV